MMICDAQVHIWATSTSERPWPTRQAPHREPLGRHRLVTAALRLPAGNHHVHGGNAVVEGPGSRRGDGARHLRMDRMEDVMLGSKRTVPLWRQRQRRLLALERALSPGKPTNETQAELALLSTKAAQRRLDEAKRRTRFSDAS